LQGVKEAKDRAAREEMHLKQHEEQQSVRFAAAAADQRAKAARLQAAIQQVPSVSMLVIELGTCPCKEWFHSQLMKCQLLAVPRTAASLEAAAKSGGCCRGS
jgi:hypothetical protein